MQKRKQKKKKQEKKKHREKLRSSQHCLPHIVTECNCVVKIKSDERYGKRTQMKIAVNNKNRNY